jgi:hypothetical protein
MFPRGVIQSCGTLRCLNTGKNSGVWTVLGELTIMTMAIIHFPLVEQLHCNNITEEIRMQKF